MTTELEIFFSVARAVLFEQSNQKRQEAENVLQSMREKKESWSTLKTILESNFQPEVQFLALTLLYQKIKEDWKQLSVEEQSHFRNSILTMSITYSSDQYPLFIRVKLAIVVGATVIRTLHLFPNSINDIFGVISTNQNLNARLMMIKILSILPEELESENMPIKRRGDLKKIFAASFTDIIHLSVSVLQTENNDIMIKLKQQVFDCVAQWISVGLTVRIVVPTPLFTLSFESLQHPELHDFSTEYLMSLLSYNTSSKESTSFTSGLKMAQKNLPSIEEDLPLLQAIFEKMLWTKNVYDAALTSNQKVCKNVALLASTVAKENTPFLGFGLGITHHAVDTLNYIMHITNCPVLDISENALEFWYMLERDISEPEEYISVYSALMDVLIKKCSFPNDIQLCNDEYFKEKFSSYRELADSVLHSTHTILKTNYFKMLANKLQEGPNTWQLVESVYYCLKTVVKIAPQTEELIKQFLQYAVNLYSQNPDLSMSKQLKITILRFLGNSSQWLSNPQCETNMLYSCTNFITGFVADQDTDIAHCASMSLSDCLSSCKNKLVENATVITTFVMKDYPRIRQEDRETILRGLTEVIFSAPTSITENLFRNVLQVIFSQILYFKETVPKLLVLELKALSTFVSPSLHKAPEVILSQVEYMFEKLQELQAFCITENEIVEEICEVINCIFKSIKNHSQPTVMPFINYAVTNYMIKPLPCYLTLISQIFEIHLQNQTMQTFFQNNINLIAQKTFETLQKEGDSELVQSFFGLMSIIVKKEPKLLINENMSIANATVSLCLSVLSNNHTDSNTYKTALNFLHVYLFDNPCPPNQWNPFIQSTLIHICPALLKSLFQGLLQKNGRYKYLDLQTTILYKLLKFHQQITVQGLKEVFKEPNFPSPIFSDQEKETLLHILTITQDRKFKMLMKDISEVINGLQTMDALGNYLG